MNSLSKKILESLLLQVGPSGTVQDILEWIRRRNYEISVNVNPVPFHDMDKWSFNLVTGNLEHDSGGFFSIDGISVVVDDGVRREWMQPIINQPEIGILGILSKEINGVMCFLLQAKIEPGNVNNVQLSPTLQATRSNYTQIHKGRKPRYLEYFLNAHRDQIILDQLQSEQGARFLGKRNRNIILRIIDDVQLNGDYCWLTLGQIKSLMKIDNIVNMDTRTVISGLSYSEYFGGLSFYDFNKAIDKYSISEIGRDLFISESASSGYQTINEILFWLSKLKSKYELKVNQVPLRSVDGWEIGEYEIVRPDRQFFRVFGVEVVIDNREVTSWHQPLVEPMQEGICAIFFKKMNGVIHFLVQAKIECGNFDVVELAPTVQCLTGPYIDERDMVPFMSYVLNNEFKRKLFDSKQSEEGGRFYHEQNRNLVVEVNDDFPEKLPENYTWLTLWQIKELLKYNNYLNIQARSLIATLNYN